MTPLSFTRAVRQATLTEADLAAVATCRGDYNRLGFAYQRAFVRLFHRFPAQQPLEVCDELLSFVALQLGLETTHLAGYAIRQSTVSDHQARIRDDLGLTPFGPEQIAALKPFIFEAALRLEPSVALLASARNILREQRILFPAESALLRVVGEQKKRAQEQMATQILQQVPTAVTAALDDLLTVKAGEAVSALQRIKTNPAKPSARAMRTLLTKLTAIEATGILSLDLSWLNSNYQRALFHYVRACSVDRLRDLPRPRRLTALICFLHQSYRDTVDQTVDMFDKILTRTHTQAEHDLDDHLRDHRRTLKESLALLRAVGAILLDEAIADEAVRARLFAVISRETLTQQLDALAEWVTGKASDVFPGVVRRQRYLRQFTPALLRTLAFFPDAQDTHVPCLKALAVLKALNARHERQLPDDTPIDFIPKRLLPFVVKDHRLDRAAWECALLLKVQDELRSGNLAVQYSKRFGRFEDYFMEPARWQAQRLSFFLRADLPADPQNVPAYLTARLNHAYDVFLETVPTNRYARLDQEGWHLSTDTTEKFDPEAQSRLDRLKQWLTAHLRTIRLPDLLIEVDNDLHFTNAFLPLAQRGERDPEEVCLRLAAVLGHGCNIGLHTMAQLTQGVSYKQLKRVSDW